MLKTPVLPDAKLGFLDSLRGSGTFRFLSACQKSLAEFAANAANRV